MPVDLSKFCLIVIQQTTLIHEFTLKSQSTFN